jgi:hypothetical protein
LNDASVLAKSLERPPSADGACRGLPDVHRRTRDEIDAVAAIALG